MPHSMFRRRLQSRPVVALVVQIGAAADDGNAEPGQESFNLAVKLVLAIVAAGAVVTDIIRIHEFIRSNDVVPDANQLGQFSGFVDLSSRHARAVARHGNGTIAEGELRGLGDDGTVNPAAERNGRTAVAVQDVDQSYAFGVEIRAQR